MQLPYYTVNMVNSDATFLDMFKNGWLADWADYNSSVFYGGSNRYGMGAGPDMEWCSLAQSLILLKRSNYIRGQCQCRYLLPLIGGYSSWRRVALCTSCHRVVWVQDNTHTDTHIQDGTGI